jgi:primosomal protein N' (replication factor Y) (superfamily II helicase)
MTIARVALDVPVDKLFDYAAPGLTRAHIGARVLVPFGKKRVVGMKHITCVFDDIVPFDAQSLSLLKFCSDYYHYPLGQVILNALPVRLKRTRPLKRKTGGKPVPISPEASGTPANPPQLNAEQEQILGSINLKGFGCTLLFGVTGSGKTEIYLNLMTRALAQGKQVLLLVPEINLSPQLEALLKQRFPQSMVVSLHSGLNEGKRLENWLAAKTGAAQIILGTRLAVFTPIPRLGLIIVDEEHDASFKQQEGLRYSARDIAIFRAKQADIPVILGSATPALESYHHALSGRYRMSALTHRAVGNAVLPSLRCIDIRRVELNEGLSAPLIAALKERLQRGEQSLIFINRRGYAPVLVCSACAWVSACSRCSSRLVLHLREKKLRCHYCGHQERVPAACPGCGNIDLIPLGQGTQRVESTLSALFPDARILRIDRDSTRRKSIWPGMLKSIQEQKVDILVGTQILAKGHDFPKLSLVGILNPDASLYSTDFRASERLFAQLMQVAGRAGRAEIPGEVLIQTQFPDHPLFEALRRHDYSVFAKTLLAERKHAGLPPFMHQALLRAEAAHSSTVMNYLADAAKLASRISHDMTIYDPVPAHMPRLAGRERGQLLVQSASRKKLQVFLKDWHGKLMAASSNKVRWAIDVDPLEF